MNKILNAISKIYEAEDKYWWMVLGFVVVTLAVLIVFN